MPAILFSTSVASEAPSSETCFSIPFSVAYHKLPLAVRPHEIIRVLSKIHIYSPKRANALGGVPSASRISIGRSGFFALMPRYDFSTNALQGRPRSWDDNNRSALMHYLCICSRDQLPTSRTHRSQLTLHPQMVATADSRGCGAP